MLHLHPLHGPLVRVEGVEFRQLHAQVSQLREKGSFLILLISAASPRGTTTCSLLLEFAADILLALGDPAWSSGTVQTLTNRAVRLLGRCGVELIVLDEFHHLFDFDKARVMTKAAQWLKVLIVNTGIPVVVAGMPEAAYVLSAEHTERRFKDRLVLACFSWRTPEGRRRCRLRGPPARHRADRPG